MEWLSKSPVVQVTVLFVGSTIAYLIAYFNGSVSAYLPFISETGAKIPEMSIFSYTLTIGSFFGILSVSYRFLVVSTMLPVQELKLRKLNFLGLVIGLLSMTGLAGVAAFPMSTVLWAHLLTAIVHFGCGFLYLSVQTFLSFKVPSPHRSAALARGRFALTLLNVASLVLLGICFPIGYFTWIKHHRKQHAYKTPQDEGFGILLASSVFEWLFEVTFLSFFLTMYKEFKKFELTVNVTEKPKNDTDSHSIERAY